MYDKVSDNTVYLRAYNNINEIISDFRDNDKTSLFVDVTYQKYKTNEKVAFLKSYKHYSKNNDAIKMLDEGYER